MGLIATDPLKSFFFASITGASIDKVMAILGDTYFPEMHQFRKKIPQCVLQSGMFSIKKNCTTEQSKDVTKYPDCVARLSFSLHPQIIPLSDGLAPIVIPSGIAFAARVNLFGWISQAEGIFSATRFYLNASAEPVVIDRILSLFQSESNQAKGPSIVVDLNLEALSAFVNVKAYASIPLLMCAGEIMIKANDAGFEGYGSLTHFGVYTQATNISWGLDLRKPNFFYAISWSVSNLDRIAQHASKLFYDVMDMAQSGYNQLDDYSTQALGGSGENFCDFLASRGRISAPLQDVCNLARKASLPVKKQLQNLFKVVTSTVNQYLPIVKEMVDYFMNNMCNIIKDAMTPGEVEPNSNTIKDRISIPKKIGFNEDMSWIDSGDHASEQLISMGKLAYSIRIDETFKNNQVTASYQMKVCRYPFEGTFTLNLETAAKMSESLWELVVANVPCLKFASLVKSWSAESLAQLNAAYKSATDMLNSIKSQFDATGVKYLSTATNGASNVVESLRGRFGLVQRKNWQRSRIDRS